MRIDKYLTNHFGSRNKATFAIEKGLILVNHKTVKSSYEVKEGDEIQILSAEKQFVSVGGFKLDKALMDFNYVVADKVLADIGASTGGFTDCLLQNGAKKIYCIDVGESLLSPSLDRSKLVVIDNFNARNLTKDLFNEPLDCVVIDVSFISLTYILEGVANALQDGKDVIALIKPQFECESHKVGKNGIVKDIKQRKAIIEKIYLFAQSCSLFAQKITNAPIVKGKNIEYLMLFTKNSTHTIELNTLLKSVNF